MRTTDGSIGDNMKRLLMLVLLALLMTGCAQCVESHEEVVTGYVSHCVVYKRGQCRYSIPMPYTYPINVCDKWVEKP